MDPDAPVANEPQPSVFRWVLGFLIVGACWGLTTPFMRKAAMLAAPSKAWLSGVQMLTYTCTETTRRPSALP